jgi:transcriptional regulator with XRE-family HTH domain
MNSPQLSNYLLPNRQRSALSQDEVAFLLGIDDGATVCRYEAFDRNPSLETALAYEAILKRSVSELFPGLYKNIEQQVAARAKTLVERTDGRKLNAREAKKRETLAGLAALVA